MVTMVVRWSGPTSYALILCSCDNGSRAHVRVPLNIWPCCSVEERLQRMQILHSVFRQE